MQRHRPFCWVPSLGSSPCYAAHRRHHRSDPHLNAIADDDAARAPLKVDLPRLKARAKLINLAIFLAVGSAICTTLLVIIAFVSAFLGFRHEPGAGLMFVVALGLLGGWLTQLAREVRIALNDYDHFG